MDKKDEAQRAHRCLVTQNIGLHWMIPQSPGQLDETYYPFRSERSLEQLAADHGIAPINHLEDLWGKGAELWADDRDFETFLAAAEGIASDSRGAVCGQPRPLIQIAPSDQILQDQILLDCAEGIGFHRRFMQAA